MVVSARVTSKGQVTIPKSVRERAGIGPGTEVEFDDRGGEIVMRRSTRGGHDAGSDGTVDPEFDAYLERVRGTLRLGMTTDEFMELLRGE